MKSTKTAQVLNNMPDLIKNTNLNIHLEGWPAAVTAISGCLTIVAIYALKVTHPTAASESQEAA